MLFSLGIVVLLLRDGPLGIHERKNAKQKNMHKMGRILILDQNYNSSRKVFQNTPNGIRACLDFKNFPTS